MLHTQREEMIQDHFRNISIRSRKKNDSAGFRIRELNSFFKWHDNCSMNVDRLKFEVFQAICMCGKCIPAQKEHQNTNNNDNKSHEPKGHQIYSAYDGDHFTQCLAFSCECRWPVRVTYSLVISINKFNA